jgi:predicted TIM-barrel fold metal-dependent hydrolase
MPRLSDLKISDDDIRETIDNNQLKLMKERGSDMTLFSPRTCFMAHHIGDFNVSATWAATCNELVYRVSALYPDNFATVAMLPQSPGVDPATCIPELEKCVKEYGAVRAIDPQTGFQFDDAKRYIEANTKLSKEEKYQVYEGNTRRVFSRLDAALKAKGK